MQQTSESDHFLAFVFIPMSNVVSPRQEEGYALLLDKVSNSTGSICEIYLPSQQSSVKFSWETFNLISNDRILTHRQNYQEVRFYHERAQLRVISVIHESPYFLPVKDMNSFFSWLEISLVDHEFSK